MSPWSEIMRVSRYKKKMTHFKASFASSWYFPGLRHQLSSAVTIKYTKTGLDSHLGWSGTGRVVGKNTPHSRHTQD